MNQIVNTDLHQDITNGHEYYLRWLLLLLQACPVALEGVIIKELKKRDTKLDVLLSNYRHHLETFAGGNHTYKFSSSESYNSEVSSWDTFMLCSLILVSFECNADRQLIDSVECILDQMNDIEKYASVASVEFIQFKSNRDSLIEQLLLLCDNIDKKARFRCIQLILSFMLEPFSVNKHLIEQLTSSKDLKSHVQLAFKEKVTSALGEIYCISMIDEETEEINKEIVKLEGEEEEGVAKAEQEEETESLVKFVKDLEDERIYVNDAVVFSCTLNKTGFHVVWKKDRMTVTNDEKMKIMSDRLTQWLVIKDAKLDDSGTYMCICEDAYTEAVLSVSEKILEVVKPLHVVGSDVIEHTDVTLSCTVNTLTKPPIWLHNGKELLCCTRVNTLSNGHTHTLTILNVQIKDEGRYTVAFGYIISETQVTVKGNNNLSHRKQLAKKMYRNWIRCTLGLKYLKQGLEQVTEIFVNQQYNGFMSRLSSFGQPCSQCGSDTLLPLHDRRHCPNKFKCICSIQPHSRKKCPNADFCSRFYDYVVLDHRSDNPTLANTDIQKWSTECWSVATTYISTPGYKGKTSSKDIDCLGLISLFLNNTFFSTNLGNIGNLNEFKKARDARNEIFHNPMYQISDKELEIYLQIFTDVLQVKDISGKMPLLGFSGVKDAIDSLKELEQFQIDISISDDIEQKIKTLRVQAMHEEAEKMKEAHSQMLLKLQRTEEKLIRTGEELRLLKQMKPALAKKKSYFRQKVKYEADICITTTGNTLEATLTGSIVVYRIMDSEINRIIERKLENDDTLDIQDYAKTDLSLRNLLQILHMKGVNFVSVLKEASCCTIRITCCSYKAFAKLIEGLNSSEFGDGVFEVRKALEQDTKGGYTYTVEANLSTRTLDEAGNSLVKQGVLKTEKNTYHCDVHLAEETTFYCSDHKTFFCQTCMETTHSSCAGLKIVTDIKPKETNTSERQTPTVYNIGVRGPKEKMVCGIIGLTEHQNGSIFLVDKENMSFKEVRMSQPERFKLQRVIPIKNDPLDICFMEKDLILISLGQLGILIVNTALPQTFHYNKVNHWCIGLASHGRKLFITDKSTVYSYVIDRSMKLTEQQRIFSRQTESDALFEHIAISSTGQVYIAAGEEGLITIDSCGNYLYTSLAKMNVDVHDVCVTGQDTVYVCDTKSQSILMVVDENSFERVLTTEEPWTLCYSNLKNMLVVGHFTANTLLFQTV